MAGPGGHWLGLDVHSTGSVRGAIGDATGTHGHGELHGTGILFTLAKSVPLMRYAINERITFCIAPSRPAMRPAPPHLASIVPQSAIGTYSLFKI